jgi:heme/copper-type cytochrome/quinol oxidase subunit 3
MSASGSGSRPGIQDDPVILGSNLRLGARVFASGVVFIFASFLFAFFYLRAINSNDLFKPAGVNAPVGFGIAILVGVLGAAVAFDLARRRLASDDQSGWRSGSAVALVLGLAVVVLQVIEYFALNFKTASGGYASVFWGWTLLFLLFWLGAVYWMETLVAQNAQHARGRLEGAELLIPSADGCMVYLYTLAAVEVVAFILLYLVK